MAGKLSQQQPNLYPLERRSPIKWDLTVSFFDRTHLHNFFLVTWEESNNAVTNGIKDVSIY